VIEEVDMSNEFIPPAPLLAEILALHAKWRPLHPAVSCDIEQLNWQQFGSINHRVAHGLLANLVPGERVGIVMSNGLPMLHTLMGSMAAGLVSVPINLSVNDDALVNMLTDAQVSALVISADQHARIQALMERLPGSIKLWVSDFDSDKRWVSLPELIEGQPESLPAIDIPPSSALNIIYSSGTTGMPKGIVHTQQGRRDWAYDLSLALRYNDQAKTLITIGLYSNISWVAMLSTLLVGGTLLLHKRFDAEAFLESIERDAVTHTAMVPIQYQRVLEVMRLNKDRRYDTSAMQSMMSCGSPLQAELKAEIFQRFPCGIIELYGLTEGIITTLSPEDAEGRWSSVGRPLMGTDIAIIDEQGQSVAAGHSGEIVSRGRITMSGYFNREQASREALYVDELGRRWLRSGDIGQLDAEGFLYIVDRKKDMILSGGQNVYPQDIEAIMSAHSEINDVAVIAAKSNRWGETPIALVVREGASESAEDDIRTWANQQLGKQQRLADVIFLKGLPRNPNGKVLKRELRQQYGAKSYE